MFIVTRKAICREVVMPTASFPQPRSLELSLNRLGWEGISLKSKKQIKIVMAGKPSTRETAAIGLGI